MLARCGTISVTGFMATALGWRGDIRERAVWRSARMSAHGPML